MPITKIGRYNVEGELGRGGMAIVYLARDPLMNRQVAVKVLPPQLTLQQSFITRFRQEVNVIAMLEHPHIVPVYDCGEHQQQPYIVMRYLRGGSLTDRLQHGPIKPDLANKVIIQMADALEEAHSQRVIHRDIKPGNILFDRRERAYLSDFGIAKVMESQGDITGVEVIGTPQFMSPEQALGEAVDARSDVYSLGVLLFVALTARLPYSVNTPMAAAMARLNKPLPKITDIQRNLSPAYQTILEKALAKEPRQRFQSAAEFGAALAEIERPKPPPISATPPPAQPTGVVLQQGANVALSNVAPQVKRLAVNVGWQGRGGLELDASVFLLGEADRVLSDEHFIFYNNLRSPDGAVHHQNDHVSGTGDEQMVEVDLPRVDASVSKIVFTLTIYEATIKRLHFGMVKQVFIRLVNPTNQQELVRYPLQDATYHETAMILGELYRHRGLWKFRAIGQGFAGGLKALTDHFGVATE